MNKKKNKILFSLLILVAVGTMLYSYDFFTSRANTANLIIKTGKLSIKAHNDDKWFFLNDNNLSEIKYEKSNNNFINAKPGDSFLKEIIIENSGTLKQNLNFIINKNLPNIINEMFDIEITGIDNKENVLLPKENKNIKIKLTLKSDEIANIHQGKEIDFKELKVFNFLTVEANQVRSI